MNVTPTVSQTHENAYAAVEAALQLKHPTIRLGALVGILTSILDDIAQGAPRPHELAASALRPIDDYATRTARPTACGDLLDLHAVPCTCPKGPR
jgi:hypothetical protein